MNIAISIAFSKSEFHDKQPNSQIVLKTGTSVYAPTIILSGDKESCVESIREIIGNLMQDFESKSSNGIVTAK